MPKKEIPDILPLLIACEMGDRLAQQQLYRWLYEKMLAIGMRYANNRTEAEAILNQACLKIFQSIGKYDRRKAFHAWARSIVLHTAIDHLRKTTAYRNKFLSERETIEDQYTINEALNKLAMEDIFQYIQQLPRAMRVVFCLFEIDGFLHKEIAEQLHISEGTSRWHLSEAKKRLREMLKPVIYQTTLLK